MTELRREFDTAATVPEGRSRDQIAVLLGVGDCGIDLMMIRSSCRVRLLCLRDQQAPAVKLRAAGKIWILSALSFSPVSYCTFSVTLTECWMVPLVAVMVML